MIKSIYFLLIALVVIAFLIPDLFKDASKLKENKIVKSILVVLAGILGPLGMFYWGIRVGLASLLCLIILTLPLSYLGFGINSWLHLLIAFVYLRVSLKINTLSTEEKESLRKLDIRSFLLLIWTIIKNFLFYGFVWYLIWKAFN